MGDHEGAGDKTPIHFTVMRRLLPGPGHDGAAAADARDRIVTLLRRAPQGMTPSLRPDERAHLTLRSSHVVVDTVLRKPVFEARCFDLTPASTPRNLLEHSGSDEIDDSAAAESREPHHLSEGDRLAFPPAAGHAVMRLEDVDGRSVAPTRSAAHFRANCAGAPRCSG